MAEKECHVYELRDRDGNTVCMSPLPMLGYSREKLLRIIADGYQYKVDGRRAKP